MSSDTTIQLTAPQELQIICTRGMTDEEIADAIQTKQAEDLPDTTLVIFARVPLEVTLTPAPECGKPALIDVKVSRDDVSLFGIDDLLGYFHALVDAYEPHIDVNFEIVGGNLFSEKLSDLYSVPPTEEEIAEYVEAQRDAIENLGRFNAAVSLMRESGEYDANATEAEVLNWYARVEAAAKGKAVVNAD